MPTPAGKTADPKRWLVAGALVGLGVTAGWVFLDVSPATTAPSEPALIASDAGAAAPAPVEPVASPRDTPAVAATTIDGGAAAGVANEPASAIASAAPQDAAVPNRLSLSVDDLVRAGLAQDVAEDLVETLNSMALGLERFPFAAAHAEAEFVLLSVPKLPAAVAKGDVTIERVDAVGAAVIVEGGESSTARCYSDGIEFVCSARRGHLRITVPERAAAPEAWQRYVAK